MPIETRGRFWVLRRVFPMLMGQKIKQGQEFALDHVVMARVSTALVRKDELVGLLAFGAGQHGEPGAQ